MLWYPLLLTRPADREPTSSSSEWHCCQQFFLLTGQDLQQCICLVAATTKLALSVLGLKFLGPGRDRAHRRAARELRRPWGGVREASWRRLTRGVTNKRTWMGLALRKGRR